MTKYVFRLLLLFGSVLAVIAFIGSLLPRDYSFTTTIEIESGSEKIFPEIDSLKNWQHWSRQWNPNEIENLQIDYSGEDRGVGATQKWTDVRGSGKLWITESVPNQSIKYEMHFSNFPKMESEIELVGGGKTTTVNWSSSGRLPGGPFYGFFGSFFSRQMKAEYEKSLEKLKMLCETEDAIPETVQK